MLLGAGRLVATQTEMIAAMPKTTTSGSCLERLLMSGLFRRYVECLIVVCAPWVLLTEQKATDMLGGDDGVDLRLHRRPVPR